MASSRHIIKILEQEGFIVKSQRGSHVKLVKDDRQVIVPHPRKDMPPGTYKSIIRQSGLPKDRFES